MTYGECMDNLIWWIVLTATVTCFLIIPGLVRLLWETIKEEYDRRNNE